VHDGSDRSFGGPSLGSIDALDDIVQRVRPTRIIVALAERPCRLPIYELLRLRANGIVVEDVVDVYERLTGKVAIERVMPSSLTFATDFWPKSGLQLFAGRLLSFAVAIYGLIGLAPLLALIALTIKLDSKGPVFFVQERIGVNGRPFKLIKFRTMHTATWPASEWVRDNQERITRVGKWLRRFRLDELPQFLNILRGDMNLVGPRPHPVSNFALFAERIPYYALRCVVRPGVTGWAQIRYGYANDLEEEIEKMKYDLYYIKHFSFALDLRILRGSVRAVLRGRESPALKMWEAA
jgi:lipopolysaccharide/colanic/teichoic acid biosynthesis glycosyltransferase